MHANCPALIMITWGNCPKAKASGRRRGSWNYSLWMGVTDNIRKHTENSLLQCKGLHIARLLGPMKIRQSIFEIWSFRIPSLHFSSLSIIWFLQIRIPLTAEGAVEKNMFCAFPIGFTMKVQRDELSREKVILAENENFLVRLL